MSQDQGWAVVEAMLKRIEKRGVPHIVSTTKAFTAFDQNLDIIFKFADQSSDFIWTHAAYSSDNAAVMAGTDTVFGGALCTMSNVGTIGPIDNGEEFPISSLFGREGICGGSKALSTPLMLKGSQTLKMNATNKVAGAQTLYLSLIGVRVI